MPLLPSALPPKGEARRYVANDFLNLIALPIREGFVRRYCFPTYACICSDNVRKAVFSFRCLPHRGRGTASAVDRVLSFILDLRRISSLFFIPLEPYPARSARHLPHAGKALSVVILFPHMRVFALTIREKRYSRFAAFPIGEGGPRSGG